MNKNILMSSFEAEMTMKLLNYNRTFRKAYICSPLKAPTVNEFFKNIELARCYVNYATEHMCVYGKAPHAVLPTILGDNSPAERALALEFGLKLLEQCDILYVCGNRISKGMKGEIGKAASLGMPIVVFDEELFVTVKKIATANGAPKQQVSLDLKHTALSSVDPDSFIDRMVSADD